MASAFRLVERNWDRELSAASSADRTHLRIICPFIQKRTAERLLSAGKPERVQVITRFSTRDFCDRVSDPAALRLLLEAGAQIRGIRNLHAKMYVFGTRRAIVTSANLTEAALLRNHEFGFVAEDPAILSACLAYFKALWPRAGATLSPERLAEMEAVVLRARLQGGRPTDTLHLPDYGARIGDSGPAPDLVVPPTDSNRAFVKLLGSSENRVYRTLPVMEEIRNAGCHWACTYPNGKRPRKVEDNSTMFIARMTKDPNDIVVFGRALGLRYVKGRDDATPEDIELRKWKAHYPHYIRVYGAEFLAGTLENGVSLNELMTAFGPDSFASTQRNQTSGGGNLDPRLAYRRRGDVELSPQGHAWLTEQLDQAFELHGRIPAVELEALDWPAVRTEALLQDRA